MGLKNIKKFKNKESGFTIVELLIVIVIIGILAALVIVAYTGIQSRARAAQYKTDAQAIQKKAEAYAASDATGDGNGKYPTSTFGTGIGKLPSGVAVQFVTTADASITNSISSSALSATSTDAMAVVSGSSNTYAVKACGTDKGLKIFYADPTSSSTGSAKSVTAGEC